jgi:hypothetical protein
MCLELSVSSSNLADVLTSIPEGRKWSFRLRNAVGDVGSSATSKSKYFLRIAAAGKKMSVPKEVTLEKAQSVAVTVPS